MNKGGLYQECKASLTFKNQCNSYYKNKEENCMITRDAAKALHKVLQIFLTQIKLSANQE